MKNLYVIIIAIFFASCESGNPDIEKSESLDEINSNALKDFTNSKIAEKADGKIKFLFSDNAILTSAKTFSEEYKLGFEPQSVAVEIINNKPYLRIYSKDDYVSTVELLLDNKSSTYTTGETVCTTNACSSGGGCVPNGQYCTACAVGPGNLPGDCLRTTKGGSVQ